MNTTDRVAALNAEEARQQQAAAYHGRLADAYERMAAEHRKRENAANEAAFDCQDERWAIRDGQLTEQRAAAIRQRARDDQEAKGYQGPAVRLGPPGTEYERGYC